MTCEKCNSEMKFESGFHIYSKEKDKYENIVIYKCIKCENTIEIES